VSFLNSMGIEISTSTATVAICHGFGIHQISKSICKIGSNNQIFFLLLGDFYCLYIGFFKYGWIDCFVKCVYVFCLKIRFKLFGSASSNGISNGEHNIWQPAR